MERELTCRELRDQPILIVQDVDRYVFGGLQEQWIALKHKFPIDVFTEVIITTTQLLHKVCNKLLI